MWSDVAHCSSNIFYLFFYTFFLKTTYSQLSSSGHIVGFLAKGKCDYRDSRSQNNLNIDDYFEVA